MLAMMFSGAWRWVAFSLMAATAIMMARPAFAADLAEADVRAVRAVVEAQLAAFAADDAERAFSYATEGIRARFGGPAEFMAMVQAGYPMVIKPAGMAFFVPTEQDGVVVQKLQLSDTTGARWLAVYQLQREGAAGWKIGGCAVLPQTAASGRALIL